MGFTWLTGLYYLAQKNILSNDCFAGYSCKQPSLWATQKFLVSFSNSQAGEAYQDTMWIPTIEGDSDTEDFTQLC